MRVRLEKNGATLLLDGQPIARGGEAAIYTVPDRPDWVGKVYHDATPEQADKLAAMIANPPADPTAKQGHTSIAWPTERLLADDRDRCVGFVMPRVDKVQSLFDIYNPKSRLQTWPLFHYGYLVRTARNLAIAVRALHARGYVLGDLNESNVLVNGQTLVTIVDTDSFQTRTPDRVFRCLVGKPEHTAPEIQNARFAELDRLPEHDHFALAVLIFQLLMQGTHPFAGRFTGEGEPEVLAKRIAAGHWPYARKRRGPYEPNTTAPAFAVLPTPLRELMRLCFEDGHERPAMRPDAGRWQKALAEADAELMECLVNPQHRFHKDLNGCPWCELMMKQGRDPFPSKEAIQSRANGAASAKTGVTAAPAPTAIPVVAVQGPPVAPRPAVAVKAPRGRSAVRKKPARALALALTPWPWVIACGLGALVVLVWLIVANARRPAVHPSTLVADARLPRKQAGDEPPDRMNDGVGDGTLDKENAPKHPGDGALPREERKPPETIPSPPPEVIPPPDRPRDPPPVVPQAKPDGQLHCFDSHKDAVNCVAISPDGKRLLSGCQDGAVYLWDIEKGEATLCDGAHLGAVHCVAFSPAGTLAASGGADAVARIWNVKDGSLARACEGHTYEILHVAFATQGLGLVTGAASGEPDPAFADGPTDGVLRIWSTQAGAAGAESKELKRYRGPPEPVSCLAFTGNFRRVLMAGPSVAVGDATSTLFTCDCQTGKATRAFQSDDLTLVYGLAVTPSGAYAASVGDAGSVLLWDMNTGKKLRGFEGHTGDVWCAAFSPTGDRLLTGGDDGTVRLWDVATGKELRSFTGHNGAVRGVAFSSDGKRAVSGGDDLTARVWDLSH